MNDLETRKKGSARSDEGEGVGTASIEAQKNMLDALRAAVRLLAACGEGWVGGNRPRQGPAKTCPALCAGLLLFCDQTRRAA